MTRLYYKVFILIIIQFILSKFYLDNKRKISVALFYHQYQDKKRINYFMSKVKELNPLIEFNDVSLCKHVKEILKGVNVFINYKICLSNQDF